MYVFRNEGTVRIEKIKIKPQSQSSAGARLQLQPDARRCAAVDDVALFLLSGRTRADFVFLFVTASLSFGLGWRGTESSSVCVRGSGMLRGTILRRINVSVGLYHPDAELSQPITQPLNSKKQNL